MIDIEFVVGYKTATLITGVTGKRSFSGAFLAFQTCIPKNPMRKELSASTQLSLPV